MTIAAGPSAGAPALSFRRLQILHTRAALVLVAAAVLAALAAGPIGGPVQFALLVAAVIVGLPHGALDHRVARARFAPGWGLYWPVPFLAGYAALAGLTLLAWRLVPALALGAFLALSALHFGECDAHKHDRSRWLRIAAHGGLPIVLPALAHPDDVGQLFGWLAGDASGAAALQVLTGPAAVLWGASLAASLGSAAARNFEAGSVSQDEALSWALTGALALLFAVLPPLAAFAFYFAAVHAPRALLETAEREPAPLPAIRRSLAGALPPTLGALLLAAAIQAMQPVGHWAPAGVRTVFWVLSALTVPHMWLAHPLRRETAPAAGLGRER